LLPFRSFDDYRLYEEEVETLFEGTIIDLETIGDFERVPYTEDMQDYLDRYCMMKVTTIGTLSDGCLNVMIAYDDEHLKRFQKSVLSSVRSAERPLYAFNKSFEEGCVYWASSCELHHFDFDIQMHQGEKKQQVVRDLGLLDYNDPYLGEGWRCVGAFREGNLGEIIRHNRSCLLKEYGILRKRGSRAFKTEWLDLPN
jgi:hypothetical protein